MNFISTIKLVIRTLLARKGRSFLTILGIVIGVAGVIIIIALGAGAQSLVLGQVTKLGSNLLSVMPGKSNEKGPPAQVFGIVVTTLTIEDAQAMRETARVPHATAVSAWVQGTATVAWQDKSIDTNFLATEYSYPLGVNLPMEQGRYFDEREERGNANVAVLGRCVYEQLFKEIGVEPLGQMIKVRSAGNAEAGGVPLRVIGVVEERGSAFFQNQDDMIFIPLRIGQKQLLGINHIQAIGIKVDSDKNVEQARSDIKALLMERHRIKREADTDFTVRNIADALEILTTITGAMRLFLTAMAAIALIVGGIGILNIMLATVAERTREIGLRKAVGARPSAIRNQFLLEAGTLTFLGGIIGIIAGVAASFFIFRLMVYLGFETWAFVISIQSVFLAAGVSILTGVIFGLYPAFRASRLNPIDALRYE